MKPTDQNADGPPTNDDASLSPFTVSHCPTLNEAQMVVSLLGSFGIEATIEGENYLRMLGSMVPGSDGIRVQVDRSDAEAALEILNPGPETETEE
ncbi:MAG: DUF2007 domain-containing protein [Acidobacteriaceae bacterium]